MPTQPPATIAFFGSDPIALPMLDALLGNREINVVLDAVITQPDRASGRGKTVKPNAIKTWAQEHDIPVLQPEKIDDAFVGWAVSRRWKLALVMAYGEILRQNMLDAPELGCFNLHASLLPKLRGASPIETAIVSGERETGVTLMKMHLALDAGPMIGHISCPIESELDAPTLRDHLAHLCPALLNTYLPKVLANEAQEIPQPTGLASYCRILDKDDGWIDFSGTCQEVINHIRGFQPWPGALIHYQGTTLKVGSASICSSPESFPESATSGTLAVTRKTIQIACKDAWIAVHHVQKPGGKMLPTNEFLNGFAMQSGTMLAFPKRYPLVASKYFKKKC